MALHGVDTRTSVFYRSVVLGPNTVVQDGVICIADSRMEKGTEKEGPKQHMEIWLLRKRTRSCLNTPIYTLVPTS